MDRYEASGVRAEITEATERGPAERIADDQAAGLITTFFEGLPTKQREVFDLVELQGLKAGEVGECCWAWRRARCACICCVPDGPSGPRFWSNTPSSRRTTDDALRDRTRQDSGSRPGRTEQ